MIDKTTCLTSLLLQIKPKIYLAKMVVLLQVTLCELC